MIRHEDLKGIGHPIDLIERTISQAISRAYFCCNKPTELAISFRCLLRFLAAHESVFSVPTAVLADHSTPIWQSTRCIE